MWRTKRHQLTVCISLFHRFCPTHTHLVEPSDSDDDYGVKPRKGKKGKGKKGKGGKAAKEMAQPLSNAEEEISGECVHMILNSGLVKVHR